MKKALTLLFSCVLIVIMHGCVKERTDNINYFNSHLTTVDTTATLVINEFCARGSNYLADELNPASDHWIELYNTTTSPINLDATNYYISMDSTVTSIGGMTRLSGFAVPAKGWIVIFSDDSNKVTSQHIHVPHISKQGGYIGLYTYHPSSATLTNLSKFVYQAIVTSGSSWGVYPDGTTNWVLYTTPSPDATNPHP